MKSNYVQNYLQKTRSANNANQMNFGGNGRYNNFVGTTAGNHYMNATGNGTTAPVQMAPQATPSHPYVINVSNSTSSAVANFTLFNGNTGLYSAGFVGNAGTYIQSGVYVSSGLGNVTYQTLVSQSLTQPFTIGSTAITSVVNAAQIQQTINVSTVDASGQSQAVPIIFLKVPYQNLTDIIVNTTPYRIDGTTALTISNVLPNAVFSLYLYPAQNINPSAQLWGNAAVNTYANPGLIRVLPSATGAQ